MEKDLITTTSAPLDFLTEIQRDPHLKSTHTRRQYSAVLGQFEAWRDGRPLTLILVEEYAAELQKAGKSPNTINQALATIRWWARRVVKLADDLADPAQAARMADIAQRVASVEDVKGKRGTRGRHLEPDELTALLRACTNDPSPLGARDAALIAVAISTGCRNEELRSITLVDIEYTIDGADLTIQHGKGDKSRVVFLYNGSLAAVNAWLDVRGAGPGPLFNPIRKAGKILTDQMLSYEGTRKILHKRFWLSKLPEAMTWHDFRRTLVGMLLDDNVDPATVQAQTGHASINQVMKYDRRPDNRRRIAIQSIEVPYKKEDIK